MYHIYFQCLADTSISLQLDSRRIAELLRSGKRQQQSQMRGTMKHCNTQTFTLRPQSQRHEALGAVRGKDVEDISQKQSEMLMVSSGRTTYVSTSLGILERCNIDHRPIYTVPSEHYCRIFKSFILLRSSVSLEKTHLLAIVYGTINVANLI